MRALMSLGLVLIFFSGGSPLWLLQPSAHFVSYAAEPETESVETEEFSSQRRSVTSRQRQAVPSCSFRSRSSASVSQNSPLSTP